MNETQNKFTSEIKDTEVGSTVINTGQPWKQQYYINNSQNTDITKWSIAGNLPEPLYDSKAVVTKNRIYLLGGRSEYRRVDAVYTASIDDDGILDNWTKADFLPEPLYDSQVIVTNNRIYLLGGYSWYGGVDVVFTASIDENGIIGKWTKGDPLPEPLFLTRSIIVKDRIYLLGGLKELFEEFMDGSFSRRAYVKTISSSKVYTALINKDGTLDKWEEYDPLPIPLSRFQSIITKNRIYLVGGDNDWNIPVNTVYMANIKDDGTLGEWITSDPLPETLSGFQAVVTKNYVYLLGGENKYRNAVNNVYIAKINEDGSLGKWTTGSPLLEPLSDFQAVVVKNFIYLLGGFRSRGSFSTIFKAPFKGGLNDYSAYYSSSL